MLGLELSVLFCTCERTEFPPCGLCRIGSVAGAAGVLVPLRTACTAENRLEMLLLHVIHHVAACLLHARVVNRVAATQAPIVLPAIAM